MTEFRRRIDASRGNSTDVENNLIDEYAAARINRRELLRRGSVIGMSLPTLAFLASCGSSNQPDDANDRTAEVKVKPGGTMRIGTLIPTGDLDPVKLTDEGSVAIVGQTGEYLIWSNTELELQPRLAESWTPTQAGRTWTFKIRQGATFSDGSKMTAEDVAATFQRLADPDNGSNALSAFSGVLSKDGVRAVDATTVEFELEAPNGNFPYLVSSDNYNTVILPKDYDGNWVKAQFNGTGPWKLERYTPNVGATYTRNPNYWGRQANPERLEIKFYEDEAAQIVAFQSGELGFLPHYSVAGGRALLTDPNVVTTEIRTVRHPQIHMRTDQEPFRDKRVRQAVALLLNRQSLIDGLFRKKADYGNDSPFAPVMPSTDKSVEQRQQDVAKAKELLEAAGKGDGFRVTLDTWRGPTLPDLAQLLQNDVKEAGIEIELSITDAATYYGDAVFGKSRWLDSTIGITDYGHRAAPNVLLTAPLTSDGPWNAARFKNPEYEALVKSYTAALDIGDQRSAATKLQLKLLDETPVIFPYFWYFLTAAHKNVSGIEASANGLSDLTKAGAVA